MRTIKFKVNQQRIRNRNSVCHIYAGTNNYLNLEFEFDGDWDGCKKAISFIRPEQKELQMLLVDDHCIVPSEAFGESQLEFYIVGKNGNYRIETQKFIIRLGE